MSGKLENNETLDKTSPFKISSQNHNQSLLTMEESSPRVGKKKEIRKKGITCLRNKPSQYGELNEALDLLLDGSSQNQLPEIVDLKSKQSTTLDPEPRSRYDSNNKSRRKASISLKDKSNMLSPIRGAGSGIV